MKRQITIAVIVFAIIILGTRILDRPWLRKQPTITKLETTQWSEYRSTEWGFRILFPGEPKHRKETIESEGKKVVGLGVELKREDIPAMFFVVHYELPVDRKDLAASREQVLDAMCFGQVKEFKGGQMKSVKKTFLGDAIGREFQFEFQDGTYIHRNKSRLFFKDNRFFQVASIATVVNADASYVDKFLDSFQWLEKK
jgi:hypothetical protein